MQVLIYDGECNMCSRFIRFVVKINRNPELFITDFNSEWTKNNVKLEPDVDSMIFLTRDNKFIYSDSIIHLLVSANIGLASLLILKLIPKRLRDSVYKLIALNRKKILSNQSCPIPTRKARDMFLS